MKSESKAWGIVDESGNLLWSRGGSSTTSHLMVYASERKANAVLNNYWIKRYLNGAPAKVKLIYNNEGD